MAKTLNKIVSGLVVEEDFSGGINFPWILSPENAEVEYNNGLVLKHSKIEKGIYRAISEGKCIIDIYNDFNPTGSNRAIISIFENEDTTLDIEEYFESGKTFAYPFIRIVKDYNSYYFYASNDFNDWEFLGSEEISLRTPKLGIKLCENGDLNYVLNKVRIYKDDSITVRGISPGDKVSVLKSGTIEVIESRIVLDHKTSCKIPISKIEKNIKIQIKIENKDGIEYLLTEGVHVDGGDTYQYDFFVSVEDEFGNTLIPLTINHMGGIDKEEYVRKFKVINDSGGVFEKCTLSILRKEDETYKRVTMASEEFGQYEQELILGSLGTGAIKYFYVKVMKDMSGAVSEIQFDLNIDIQ